MILRHLSHGLTNLFVSLSVLKIFNLIKITMKICDKKISVIIFFGGHQVLLKGAPTTGRMHMVMAQFNIFPQSYQF